MSLKPDPHHPAAAQIAAMQAGQLSSLDVLEMYLERISSLNPDLNAVVALAPEQARAAARRADEAQRYGHSLGPLHGLPMTVKDAFFVRDMPCTGGAVEFADHIPTADAPAVARLRSAGAVIFGKTNVPTWSGDSQTNNAVYGRTNNPWRADLSPGGSSGGSAAAIAAGLSGAELGGDLGGSIRIPASHCGIYGHKPSQGIVPGLGSFVFPGSQTATRDLEVIGPLARSVTDLQLLLQVLVGPLCTRTLRPLSHRPVRRIVAWLAEPDHPIDHEVSSTFDDALTALSLSGIDVDRTSRPPIDLKRAYALSVELAGAALAFAPDPADSESRAAPSPLALAKRMSHRTWLELDDLRRQWRSAWGRFLADVDAVLCPVTATTATPHDNLDTGSRMVNVNGNPTPEVSGNAWTVSVTGLHLPATVIPAGLTSSGLPTGLMVVGRYLDDWNTLATAAELDRIIGGHRIPPRYG